jgi:hypothetical protein
MFQVTGNQQESLERIWSGLHPGMRITEASFSGVNNLEEGVKIAFKARVPNFATNNRSSLTLTSSFVQSTLASTYAPLTERKYDVQIPYPWTLEEELIIKLPDGFRPQAVPENVALESKFGQCAVTYQFDAESGTLSIRQRFQLKATRIDLQDYDPFRRFCLDVDKALVKEIVLKRET